MCGIAAVYNFKGINESDKKLLASMNRRIKHRGPDGEGFFFSDKTGLSHCRLSIIDRSAEAAQPMNYKNKYTIVFNGEIYNYIEIRNELKKSGYHFETESDTEVILAAYDKYGVDCLEHFNGMWAFILLDKIHGYLFIARDRFGVKPLFYYKGDGYYLFASEIKAILCDPKIQRIANDELVYDFLSDSLLDHTDATFYQGIYKVPAGNYAVMKLDEWSDIKFSEYYFVDFTDTDEKLDLRDACIEFRKLFNDAVVKRLRADVPVGTCLSGGLDSSSIVTAVNNIYSKRDKQQHTFSFCPDDKSINEETFIKAVVDGTDIISHYVDDSSFEIEKDFKILVEAQDEPFRTMSMFAGYLVYKEARENCITVLLDGQGADEILCGYRKSRVYYIRDLIECHKYFTAFKELLLSISQVKTTSSVRSDAEKLIKIFNKNREPFQSRYLKAEFLSEHCSKQVYDKKNFQDVNFRQISLPVLLRYVDRNSMAVSVESRLPFLDYKLVNLCAKMPVSMKIKNGYSKYVMRRALDMPEKVRKRKSKYGFTVPEKMWLNTYESFFRGFFDEGRFRAGKYIQNKMILRDWKKLINGNDENLLFRMISVAAWMEQFDVHTC